MYVRENYVCVCIHMHILYIIRTHKQTWGADETSTKRGTRAESTPNSSSTCVSAVRTYPKMPRGRSSLLKRRSHTLLA